MVGIIRGIGSKMKSAQESSLYTIHSDVSQDGLEVSVKLYYAICQKNR
jgi:hypothetical protein